MKCEFLKEDPRLSCTINDESLYIPSAYQLREYCRTERHAICPFFSNRSLDNGSAAQPAI
jgi:hypothetical protein